MKLSPNFSLTELTSTTAKLPNIPNAAIIENLKRLAAGLELVRSACGNKPIKINSGYRSEEVNLSVGGNKRSAHLSGYAADIVIPGLQTIEVCELIRAAGIRYDQMIDENSRWVHISFAPAMRQQWLIFSKGIYSQHT